MGRNIEEKDIMNGKLKDLLKDQIEEFPSGSSPKSPNQDGRPTSMVIKKAHTMFPAHLIAEAISTLRSLDLRWSGPITPSEMLYVEQYVFAKYPQYSNGLVDRIEGDNQKLEIESSLSTSSEESSSATPNRSPRNKELLTPFSFNSSHTDLDRTQMEPSRLLDIITKKSSFQGTFVSIPEVQARNKALKHCGLPEEDYLVLFMANYKDAMVMIGESYPFFKGNYYMTIIIEELDSIKEYATNKESRVISAPETWLDLRIKGSQLSQYFRRKCKHSPKGLFSYPATVNETKYSMHWISEAHRNSWHVLLDATGLNLGEDRLSLAMYRPDFVLCTLNNTHSQPSSITCLLVRRKTFDTMAPPS